MSRMDADMFRTFRRYKHMRQADLARVLGVHWNTIYNVENDRHDASPELQKKFAELVNKHHTQGAENGN